MLTQRVELGCVGEYRNDGARDVIISTCTTSSDTDPRAACARGCGSARLSVRQDHVIEKMLTSASVLALQMYGVCSLFREVNCVSKIRYNPFFVVQLRTSLFIVSL